MARVDAALALDGVFAAHRDHLAIGVLHVHLHFAVERRALDARHFAGDAPAHRGHFRGHGLRRGLALHLRDGRHRGVALLRGVAKPQLERKALGDLVVHRERDAVTHRAAHLVLGAQRLGLDGGAIGELVVETAARFTPALREVGAGVVEAAVGLGDERLRLEVGGVVLHLDPGRIALQRVDAAFAPRDLADHEGALAQLHREVGAGEREGRERVLVLHVDPAHLHAVGDLHLAVDAHHPELLAALVDFVGDANGDGVQVAVDARHRRLEEDPPGEDLDLVVGEARLRHARQDDGGLVAVARDDLDLLAVDERALGVELERARGAVGAQLLDHLARRVAAGEGVHRHVVVLVVLPQAGERAVVVGELAQLRVGIGGEVAPQQVGALVVDAHVELRGRLRVEAAHRGVPVHRVELVGLDVAEQALLRVLVGIVGRGEEILALDLSFEVKRGAHARVALSGVPVARQVRELLLEGVGGARRHQGARIHVAQVDDALDHAGGDHAAQLGKEVEARLRLEFAARGVHLALARLERRQQQEFAAAALDEDLQAGLARVEVLGVPAPARGFERERGAHGHRRALRVGELHDHFHRGLAVGDAARGGHVEDDLREAIRRHHAQGAAAALVAEGIDLRDHERVLAGLQFHAHVFPGLHLLVGEHRALAHAPIGDFGSVHGELEGRSRGALHTHVRLRVGEGLSVAELDEGELVVGERGDDIFERHAGPGLRRLRERREHGGLHVRRGRRHLRRHAGSHRRKSSGARCRRGRRARHAVGGSELHHAARRQRLHVGDRARLGEELRAGQCAQLVGAGRGERALLDFAHHRLVATRDGEIGARHLARLQVDDAARPIAQVARADRGELRARRQRGAVHLHDVRAVGDSVEAELAAAVGDDVGAVLEDHAHARHALLAAVLDAVRVAVHEHLAEDEALVAEDPARHAHFHGGDVGNGGGSRHGIARLHPVDAVALQGAGADAHAIGDRHLRIALEVSQREREARTASAHRVGDRDAVAARRSLHVGEARGKRVGEHHVGAIEDVAGAVTHAHRVIDEVAQLGHLARGLLLHEEPVLGHAVERNVHHHAARGDVEQVAVGAAARESAHVQVAIGRQVRIGDRRGEAIAVGCMHGEAIVAGRGGEREAPVAARGHRRHDFGRAASAARSRDERHRGAGDRLVGDAVEHHAHRVHQRHHVGDAPPAAQDLELEDVVGRALDDAVAGNHGRCAHVQRGNHEHAGIGAGLARDRFLALAVGPGDDDGARVDRGGVGVARGRVGADEEVVAHHRPDRRRRIAGVGEIADGVVGLAGDVLAVDQRGVAHHERSRGGAADDERGHVGIDDLLGARGFRDRLGARRMHIHQHAQALAGGQHLRPTLDDAHIGRIHHAGERAAAGNLVVDVGGGGPTRLAVAEVVHHRAHRLLAVAAIGEVVRIGHVLAAADQRLVVGVERHAAGLRHGVDVVVDGHEAGRRGGRARRLAHFVRARRRGLGERHLDHDVVARAGGERPGIRAAVAVGVGERRHAVGLEERDHRARGEGAAGERDVEGVGDGAEVGEDVGERDRGAGVGGRHARAGKAQVDRAVHRVRGAGELAQLVGARRAVVVVLGGIHHLGADGDAGLDGDVEGDRALAIGRNVVDPRGHRAGRAHVPVVGDLRRARALAVGAGDAIGKCRRAGAAPAPAAGDIAHARGELVCDEELGARLVAGRVGDGHGDHRQGRRPVDARKRLAGHGAIARRVVQQRHRVGDGGHDRAAGARRVDARACIVRGEAAPGPARERTAPRAACCYPAGRRHWRRAAARHSCSTRRRGRSR